MFGNIGNFLVLSDDRSKLIFCLFPFLLCRLAGTAAANDLRHSHFQKPLRQSELLCCTAFSAVPKTVLSKIIFCVLVLDEVLFCIFRECPKNAFQCIIHFLSFLLSDAP